MQNDQREPSRLPVRGTFGLVGTVAALALLLSFRSAPSLPPGATVANDDEETQAIAATATESGAAEAESEPGAAAQASVSEVAPEETIEAAAEPVTELATGEALTATGDAITIRWGEVQVAVTVEGDDIIDVATLAMPMSDRRSQRINTYAEPVLREEAIAIDSSDVSVVSGATYTSQAYASSLQSALDQLGA